MYIFVIYVHVIYMYVHCLDWILGYKCFCIHSHCLGLRWEGRGEGAWVEVKFWERSIILSLTENYVKIDAASTIRMEDN